MNILGRWTEPLGPETYKIVSRFFWITYRHEMVPLSGTSFTSDSGWGCMIRSGQMLAASAICDTLLGNGFHLTEADPVLRRFILSLFVDSPSAILSLHNIVAEGEKIGKRVGEWHAPSVTSRCISELVNSHLSIGMRSYSAVDMTVKLDKISKLLDGCKVLVWIPMRLGVDVINAVYTSCIKELFCTPHSVGIAGGRPNSALYFIGYVGDELIYLDPHFSRSAVLEDRATSPESISEQELCTYSCPDVKKVAISAIDPCFVAGFLIPDQQALQSWAQALLQIRTTDGDCLISFEAASQHSLEDRTNTVDIDEDVVDIDFEPL